MNCTLHLYFRQSGCWKTGLTGLLVQIQKHFKNRIAVACTHLEAGHDSRLKQHQSRGKALYNKCIINVITWRWLPDPVFHTDNKHMVSLLHSVAHISQPDSEQSDYRENLQQAHGGTTHIPDKLPSHTSLTSHSHLIK